MNDLTPTQRVKTQRWLQLIHECRESGLTNSQWCEQNGISLKSYYYWLAKLRKMAVDDLPRKNYGTRTTHTPEPVFAQVAVPESQPAPVPIPTSVSPGNILIHLSSSVIELPTDVPERLLISVIKAVSGC